MLDYAKRYKSEYHDFAKAEDRLNFLKRILHEKGIGEWNPRVEVVDIDVDLCTDFTSTIEQIYCTYAAKCGKTIWGDKTPSYTPHLSQLNKYFPNSKFIHLIRDGRDVALSCQRQPWGHTSLSLIIEDWKNVVSCVMQVGSVLGKEKYMELRYEDLVVNPKDTMKKVLAFINVPFEHSVLREHGGHHEHLVPERSKAFHTYISKPPDSSFAFKWKKLLGKTDQALCNEIAGDLLDELYYPLGYKNASTINLQGRRLYHYLHEGLAWRLNRLRNKFHHDDYH